MFVHAVVYKGLTKYPLHTYRSMLFWPSIWEGGGGGGRREEKNGGEMGGKKGSYDTNC